MSLTTKKVIHTDRCLAAARRTIGVSSEDKVEKSFRSSSRIWGDTFEYAGGKRAAEDVREENHSAWANRLSNGI